MESEDKREIQPVRKDRPYENAQTPRRLKPALYEIGLVAAMNVARGSKPMAA